MNLTTLIYKANKKVDHTEDETWQYIESLTPEEVLELIELGILYCARNKIDPIEGLEEKYKGERFKVWIPIVPPGFNQMYGVTTYKDEETGKIKARMYKKKVAYDWIEAATMPIRTAANYVGFIIDPYKDRIIIRFWVYNARKDVDAPVKLVQDTIAKVLGFDDKIVIDVHPRKLKDKTKDAGIFIEVEKERKF